MTRYRSAALAALIMISAPAVAQRDGGAAQIQALLSNPSVDAPTVGLQLSDEVTAQADIARFTVAVNSDGNNAEEALRANSTATAVVIAALREQGVTDADFEQGHVSLNQKRNYRSGNVRGYTASNSISVETHDVGRVRLMIAAAVAAGATEAHGPQFDKEDMTALLSPLRESLYRQGLAQANDYARAAGYTRVVPVAIEESVVAPRNDATEYAAMAMMAADAAAEELESMAPPLPSTEVTYRIRLTVVYRLHH